MGRIVLGIIAGVVTAFATIALTELIGSLIFSPSPATPTREWVEALPLAAKLLVVAGWFLGALAGAAIAGRIARRSAIGWIPAALVILGGIANVAMIPHPVWMVIAAFAAPAIGGWLGVRLAVPGRHLRR